MSLNLQNSYPITYHIMIVQIDVFKLNMGYCNVDAKHEASEPTGLIQIVVLRSQYHHDQTPEADLYIVHLISY